MQTACDGKNLACSGNRKEDSGAGAWRVGCQGVRVRMQRRAGAGPQGDLASLCLLELPEDLWVWPCVLRVLGVERRWDQPWQRCEEGGPPTQPRDKEGF